MATDLTDTFAFTSYFLPFFFLSNRRVSRSYLQLPDTLAYTEHTLASATLTNQRTTEKRSTAADLLRRSPAGGPQKDVRMEEKAKRRLRGHGVRCILGETRGAQLLVDTVEI